MYYVCYTRLTIITFFSKSALTESNTKLIHHTDVDFIQYVNQIPSHTSKIDWIPRKKLYFITLANNKSFPIRFRHVFDAYLIKVL